MSHTAYLQIQLVVSVTHLPLCVLTKGVRVVGMAPFAPAGRYRNYTNLQQKALLSIDGHYIPFYSLVKEILDKETHL